MSGVLQILVSAFSPRALLPLAAAVLLAGCGQKGPLVLPSGAAASGRAALPDTLIPDALRPPTGVEPSTTTIRPAAPAASAPAGSPAPAELPPTGTVSPGHTDQ